MGAGAERAADVHGEPGLGGRAVLAARGAGGGAFPTAVEQPASAAAAAAAAARLSASHPSATVRFFVAVVSLATVRFLLRSSLWRADPTFAVRSLRQFTTFLMGTKAFGYSLLPQVDAPETGPCKPP